MQYEEAEYMGLHLNDLIIFDLETSGLNPGYNEIIQFAGIHTGSGETFEIKLFFGLNKANEKALEVNGYSRRIWKRNAVSQEEGCQQICDWISKFKTCNKTSKKGTIYKVAVLGGYNCNAFDKSFLINLFKKQGIFLPADYRFFDFYPLAMFLNLYEEDYKLEAINELYELPKLDAHDALNDVVMTKNIAVELLNDIYEFEDLPQWARKYKG